MSRSKLKILQAVKQEVSLEKLIDKVNEAKKKLSRVASHQHIEIYKLVDGLINDMTNHPYGIKENNYIPQILNCTDLAITHILHVFNKNEFLRGYYEEFIKEPTEEFEARLGYVDSLVQLAIALNAFNGSSVFEDSEIDIGNKWEELKKTKVQKARKKLKGIENPNNYYLTSSYKALTEFRELVVNRFHQVDRAPHY